MAEIMVFVILGLMALYGWLYYEPKRKKKDIEQNNEDLKRDRAGKMSGVRKVS